MSKFYGAIGYAVSTEGNSGVWRDEIRRLNYYGDVIRDTRQYQTGDRSDTVLSSDIDSFSPVCADSSFFCRLSFVHFNVYESSG